jgi:hypothetical protein
VGKRKVHQETCFFTELGSHFFEGDPDLKDMSGSLWYLQASPFRRSVMERFCKGIRKFANPPTLRPRSEGWESLSRRGHRSMSRRLRPLVDIRFRTAPTGGHAVYRHSFPRHH